MIALSGDASQLALVFDAPPATGDELLAALRARGLVRMARLVLTRNRRTMVSWRGTTLRVHAGYAQAPEHVWRAIVQFVEARTRREQAEGRAALLAWKLPADAPVRARRATVTHPEDAPLVARLAQWHTELNVSRFGGTLGPIAIHVSRRLARRLGHYVPPGEGAAAEIVISRRHIRRHGWESARETLLHEMVHQWQAETGRPLDHGSEFRRKAREVGCAPRATARG
ncbi:MAG: SprT-like domain-containing protein [Gemmatimonadaceae bacterium]|nr:SprT-like domain-containing protein [Gemmatimonadaceae bacterium]